MVRLRILLALLLVTPLAAQEPAPAAQLAALDVVVVDADGRPVPALTADRFEVVVAAQPRPVVSAQYVSANAAAPPAGAGAASLIASSEGRRLLIAVDAASFSDEESLGIGATAQTLVDRLEKTDRVGMIVFPEGPAIATTTDRAPVRQVLENISSRADVASNEYSRTANGLRQALLALEEQTRLSTVVLITAGSHAADPVNDPSGSRQLLEPLSQQAAARNASVYVLFVGRSFLDLTLPHKLVPTGEPARTVQDDEQFGNWLASAAGSTGGALIKVVGASSEPAVDRLLSETSAFYRLTVDLAEAAPRTAPRPLKVTVKQDGVIVRSRSWVGAGATIDRAPAESTAAISGDASSERRTVRRGPTVPPDSIAGAYARGEFAAVRDRLETTTDLARWIGAVRNAGELWPDAPRRTAVFALEIAAVALGREDKDASREAIALLVERGNSMSAGRPDAFQCAWYWAGLMLFQSSAIADAARPFIGQALARCPNEPRIVLTEAVIADQMSPVLGPAIRTGAAAAAEAAVHESVLARYRVARAFPETTAEAQVREAWLLFRLKRYDEALRLVSEIPPLPEGSDSAGYQDELQRQVDYVAHFVRGQVLRDIRNFDAAKQAFRDALRVWPDAQSARVSLMTLLATQGERAEAETLAAAVERAPASASDPWWWFWQGDRQLYAPLIARLRELAR